MVLQKEHVYVEPQGEEAQSLLAGVAPSPGEDPTVPPAVVEKDSFISWIERFLGLSYIQKEGMTFESSDGARRVRCVEGSANYAHFEMLSGGAVFEDHEVLVQ